MKTDIYLPLFFTGLLFIAWGIGCILLKRFIGKQLFYWWEYPKSEKIVRTLAWIFAVMSFTTTIYKTMLGEVQKTIQWFAVSIVVLLGLLTLPISKKVAEKMNRFLKSWMEDSNLVGIQLILFGILICILSLLAKRSP